MRVQDITHLVIIKQRTFASIDVYYRSTFIVCLWQKSEAASLYRVDISLHGSIESEREGV